MEENLDKHICERKWLDDSFTNPFASQVSF